VKRMEVMKRCGLMGLEVLMRRLGVGGENGGARDRRVVIRWVGAFRAAI